MTTHTVGQRPARTAISVAARSQHVLWLAAAFLLAFLTPYVLADTLELPRDLYYALYGGLVLGFAWAWGRVTGESWHALVRRRLRLTLLLAAVGGALLVPAVLRAEDAGERANGVALLGQLLWRGLFYGAVDGLLLAALPIVIVYAAFDHSRFAARPIIQKTGIVAAALAASIAMTTVYHVGYSDFRSDKVAKPLVGNAAWSVPTLATANPIGAPIAHVVLHVTAVLRDPDSETFLPPH